MVALVLLGLLFLLEMGGIMEYEAAALTIAIATTTSKVPIMLQLLLMTVMAVVVFVIMITMQSLVVCRHPSCGHPCCHLIFIHVFGKVQQCYH